MAAETKLWESTTWGKDCTHLWSGGSTALGMPGIQLTVLSLSHVGLGDAGTQLLCRGIGRYSMLLTCSTSITVYHVACLGKATDG